MVEDEVGTEVASHLTHALAVHAASPVGSAASSALPAAGWTARKLPEVSASALAAPPNGPAAKVAGAPAAAKAAAPSACEPER
jgi:hypothetical protein